MAVVAGWISPSLGGVVRVHAHGAALLLECQWLRRTCSALQASLPSPVAIVYWRTCERAKHSPSRPDRTGPCTAWALHDDVSFTVRVNCDETGASSEWTARMAPPLHCLASGALAVRRRGRAAQRSRASRLTLPGSVTPSRTDYQGVLIPRPARWLESGVLSRARAGGPHGSRQAALQVRLQPPAPPKRQNANTLAGLGSSRVLQSIVI
jgi:hypothetical protein